MNQRERMLSGLPYKAWLDGLEEDRKACKQKIYDFNQLPPSRQSKEAPQMIKNIFGKTGENVWVEAPFHCDYGWNIEVGENFYSNYNLTILDVGKVTCGKNVQIAPNVSIYTAGHPVHPDSRNSGYEYGIPVTVGDNVWIGGNTVILPGVTVGSNVVIGSGNRPGTLTHSSVFSLYKDRQGTIWIGTYYGGINYFNQTKDVFYYYAYDKLRNDCLNFPFVGNMLEDEERTLWICTDGGGINCLNRKSGEFSYYTASDPGSILHNNAKTIAYRSSQMKPRCGCSAPCL